MYKLVIQDDEGKTTVVPLIRDELTIGRKEGNTIRLTERNVSRAHARLTRSNGTVVIEDLNSYNGIRVNGSRIQGRATIAETDRVQIGDYLIEIRSAQTDAAAVPGEETQPLNKNGAGAHDNHNNQETTQLPISESTPGASGPVAAPAPAGAPLSAAAVAAVPEVVALADTDPGRAATSISNHGRLVVLSTNFPGQEFVLDKASMVVGRTDENDIWLNHRSISRHHAKVVLENGRYSIEDLQSSNGVRVNGEEYGKVELRRADVIDLGHVRLRFVEPGEDFVFGRDAQPVEVFPEGGNKTWLYAALAGGLLIGAIALFMVMSGGNGDKSAGSGLDDAGTIAENVIDGGTIAMAVADAADTVQAVAIDANNTTAVDAAELAKMIADADKKLNSKNWSEALEAAKQAAALDPANKRAKEIEKTARAELVAEKAINDLRKAAKSRDYDSFPKLATELENTRWGPEATKIVDQAKAREVRNNISKLRSLARQNKCTEFKSALRRVKLAVAQRELRRSVSCKEKVVQNGDGDGDGDGDGTGSGSDTPTVSVDEKKAQLTSAITSGKFKKAYSLCDELGSSVALKCTLAACRDKNQARAKRYYNKVRSASGKASVKQLCRGNGFELK